MGTKNPAIPGMTSLDGVELAIAQATAAAKERAVTMVGGPGVVRDLLRAGVVDELRIDLMPVLLGRGLAS